MNSVVTALLSNDNASRKEAERLYSVEKSKNPCGVFEGLLNSFSAFNSQIAEKSLCLVLLRRLLLQTPSSELHEKLPKELKSKTKQFLLQVLSTDADISIRKKTGQLIAVFAKEEKDEWQDLVLFLINLIQSSKQLDKISGLFALNFLAEFDEIRILPHSKQFCALVLPLMNSENEDLSVRIAALKAVCSVLQSMKEMDKEFEDLIPGMMTVLAFSLQKQEELVVQETLKALLEVLETHPRFLRNNVADLSRFVCDNIVKKRDNDDFEEETKTLSLELVCSVCEKSQVELRKSPEVVDQLLGVGMEVIANGISVQTIQDSNEETETLLDDEEEFRKTGEDLVLRLSKSVGNSIILPIAFPKIEMFLQQKNSFQLLTAGLITISLLSQNTLKGGEEFFRNINHIVSLVVQFVAPSDNVANQRVVFSALHCLATMFYSFSDLDMDARLLSCNSISNKDQRDDLTEEQEEEVLVQFYSSFTVPVMSKITECLNMDSFSWKLKQEMASTLLAIFSSISEKDVFVKNFGNQEQLLQGLFQLIQQSPNDLFAVKVEGLTTVSSLATVLQKEFGKYYDHFMPITKELIAFCFSPNAATLPENCEMLKGQAMDCVGLLGASVPKEKFEQDARFVLDLFVNQTSQFNNNGDESNIEKSQESKEYLVRACCRIMTTMGYDSSFTMYLRHLLPPLMEMASSKVDISVFDSNADEDVGGNNQNSMGVSKLDINVRGVGEKRVEINTWAVQDKELAMNMIFAYCDTFEEFFLPFAVQTYQLVHPELISPMYNLRLAATFVTPKVLNCLAKSVYLINNMKQSFDSTDGAGKVSSTEEFEQKKQRFAQFLTESGIDAAHLQELNASFLQNVFSDLLQGLNDSLFYSLEEEDEMIQEDLDLFEAAEEEESSELYLVTAESLASLLRLSFESGGMTDNNIDVLLDPSYNHLQMKPLFNVVQVKETLQTIISIMQRRVEKRVRMANFLTKGSSSSEKIDGHLLQVLEHCDKNMNEFLDSMSEAVGCLIKAQSSVDSVQLVSIFRETCHPFAMELLSQPDESFQVVPQLKSVALFFYDDLFEFIAPGTGNEFLPFILPNLIALSQHSNYLVRQAACYGLGVVAENCEFPANESAMLCNQILESLQKVVTSPKANQGSHSSATDNAISSLYKLLVFKRSQLNVDIFPIFQSLLTLLPLKTDLIESKTLNLRLINHLNSKDEFGQKFENEIRKVLSDSLASQKGFDEDISGFHVHTSLLSEKSRSFLSN